MNSIAPLIHGKIFKSRIMVAGGAFLVSLSAWMRFFLSLINWDYYRSLQIQPGAAYLLVYGLVSALVYTSAGILVLIPDDKWKKPVSILLMAGLVIYWIDRLCFARSIEAQTALPFSLLLSAGLTLLALCLLNRGFPGRRLKNWNEINDRK